MCYGHAPRALALALAVGVGVAACTADTGGTRAEPKREVLYFPLLEGRSGLEAIARGVLTLRKGCVFLVSKEAPKRLLPLWPAGFSAAIAPHGSLVVRDETGGEVGREGEAVILGGGHTRKLRSVVELVGASPPAACRARHFWIVSEAVDEIPGE